MFALTIITGLVLQKWVLPLPVWLPVRLLVLATWGSVLFGAGFIISASALFRRTGQNPEPWKSTPEMIFKGPYRLSRNPMYVGMALLQAAVGLWQSNGWILVFLPLALFGVFLTAIRHEEAYLERKFGDADRSYRSSVRRWL